MARHDLYAPVFQRDTHFAFFLLLSFSLFYLSDTLYLEFLSRGYWIVCLLLLSISRLVNHDLLRLRMRIRVRYTELCLILSDWSTRTRSICCQVFHLTLPTCLPLDSLVSARC
jgi:hypothetical protein